MPLYLKRPDDGQCPQRNRELRGGVRQASSTSCCMALRKRRRHCDILNGARIRRGTPDETVPTATFTLIGLLTREGAANDASLAAHTKPSLLQRTWRESVAVAYASMSRASLAHHDTTTRRRLRSHDAPSNSNRSTRSYRPRKSTRSHLFDRERLPGEIERATTRAVTTKRG